MEQKLHVHIRESVDSLCRDDTDMPKNTLENIASGNAIFFSLITRNVTTSDLFARTIRMRVRVRALLYV